MGTRAALLSLLAASGVAHEKHLLPHVKHPEGKHPASHQHHGVSHSKKEGVHKRFSSDKKHRHLAPAHVELERKRDDGPKTCSMTPFCEDKGLFHDGAKYNIHDFCETRAKACASANSHGTGLRMCHMFGLYADCSVTDSSCDGVLDKDDILGFCGEKRYNPSEDKKICGLTGFCEKKASVDSKDKSYKDYCGSLEAGCKSKNDKGTGLKLCMAYAAYTDCGLKDVGNCDGNLGKEEMTIMCNK